MASQTFVEEGVIGIQEVQDAAILPQQAFKEKLRLQPERLPQVVIEIGKDLRIRPNRLPSQLIFPRFQTMLWLPLSYLLGRATTRTNCG